MTTPDPETDLRVYFAAERTLLAWVRTGITVMAFGFVIARFGLFLRLVHPAAAEASASALSPIIGAAMVWLGVAATAGGAWQHHAFCKRLRAQERPPRYALGFALLFAWALAVSGLLLGTALIG